MKRFRKLKSMILSALAGCFMWGSTVFAAMPDIMPLSEVQPGMMGVAYTVMDQSDEIKSFDVSINGILAGSKGNEPRIVATVSGNVIDHTGGLISGMSGSPVYVNGRLIGALSATLKEMNTDTALITPIEGMLELWKLPDRKNKTEFKQIDTSDFEKDREKRAKQLEKQLRSIEERLAAISGRTLPPLENEGKKNNPEDEESGLASDASEENVTADDMSESEDSSIAADSAEPAEEDKPLEEADIAAEGQNTSGDGNENIEKESATEPKMAMQAAGFGERGLAFLKETMKKRGVYSIEEAGLDVSRTQSVKTDAVLYPGSAVGVAAAIGDFSVAAIGTVTAVDDKNMLAFGHPFIHHGNANFFMTDANVIGSAHGPVNGMKLAEATSIIGRINQDRSEGIAGIIGELPQSVPVIVTVHDKDLERDITYNSAIAYDEDFVPGLAASISYAAMAKTSDRLSGSTADVKFAIRSNVVKEGKLERSNTFYNVEDVGQVAVVELATILDMICSNKEREMNLTDVKVDITMDSNRRTASILTAIPDKMEAAPGETINFKVSIKPFRKAKEMVTVPYTIPMTQRKGPLTLDIRGGGLISIAELILAQQEAIGMDMNAEEDKSISVEEEINKCLESFKNNEIIIEPSPDGTIMSDAEMKKAIKEAAEASRKLEEMIKKGLYDPKKEQPPAVSRYTTRYIIDNVVKSTINIVKKK